MARGKIQIKKIENPTNRQVTYSKRRNGLFKKANELSVLCDAKVSIIMVSSTNKIHEYISPSATTKEIIDEYQKTLGIDIWSSHYKRMQENLKSMKEVNNQLRREIRMRAGQGLNDLSFEELYDLEQDMESSLKIVRDRKYKVLDNQISVWKKKEKSMQDINKGLLQGFDRRDEDPHYGLVEDGGEFDTVLGYQNGGSRIFALRLQPNQPNFHGGGGSDLTFSLLE